MRKIHRSDTEKTNKIFSSSGNSKIEGYLIQFGLCSGHLFLNLIHQSTRFVQRTYPPSVCRRIFLLRRKQNKTKQNKNTLLKHLYAFLSRYNRNQVRVDQASVLGSLGGAGGALLLGSSAVSGAVVGLVGGTFAMGIYNTVCAERHI